MPLNLSSKKERKKEKTNKLKNKTNKTNFEQIKIRSSFPLRTTTTKTTQTQTWQTIDPAVGIQRLKHFFMEVEEEAVTNWVKCDFPFIKFDSDDEFLLCAAYMLIAKQINPQAQLYLCRPVVPEYCK